jgi:hypothetical protein
MDWRIVVFGSTGAGKRIILNAVDARMACAPQSRRDRLLQVPRGFKTGVGFEEDLITSGLRALLDLQVLGLLAGALVQEVLCRIRDERFKPVKQHCHAAYVGTLGVFAASELGGPLPIEILREVVNIGSTILETLTALVNETVRLKDIPKMQVVIYEDKFYSVSNRRL